LDRFARLSQATGWTRGYAGRQFGAGIGRVLLNATYLAWCPETTESARFRLTKHTRKRNQISWMVARTFIGSANPEGWHLQSLKQFVKSVVRQLVFCAPWGVREAMLDACLDRVGNWEVALRLLPKLKIVEIGAAGDRGVVTSSWNDQAVLAEYALTGTFAETVTKELVNFFGTDGGTYLDIGANIGLTTIPIARNPHVRCLAFEPEPLNFEFLKRNVARNAEGSSVEFHQVALFHSRTSMSLAIADKNIGDHRLTIGSVPGRRTIEITAVPFDDFIDRIAGPLAVKVDTQGAEPFIIAGGRKVFAKADLLVMEFCPYLMRQLGGDPNIVIELMSDFDRVAVMKGGISEVLSYIRPVEAESILRDKLRTATASDGDYLDIMAIRGSRIT